MLAEFSLFENEERISGLIVSHRSIKEYMACIVPFELFQVRNSQTAPTKQRSTVVQTLIRLLILDLNLAFSSRVPILTRPVLMSLVLIENVRAM
jgi:hypothetical protein